MPSSSKTSATASAGGGVQFGPVGRWWDDKSVVSTVGLSVTQKQKMDTIFNANKPAILSAYKNFLAEQTKLNALSKDPNADQSKVFATIDAMNQARSELQKTTAKMYMEIRQQMTAEQIEKIEKMK